MTLDMKKILDLKAVTFGAWGLKTNLCNFSPKPLVGDLYHKPKFRILTQIFTETGHHFLQNHKMNSIKSYLKKFLGLWGLEIKFGLLGPKRCIKP